MKKLIIVLGLFFCLPFAFAQQKPVAGGDKAIWEPINYPADVTLNDVFFATEREGWVVGGTSYGGGMILHTSDAGDHWDLQAGDPESSEKGFSDLRFIDATHGWVVQHGEMLLHTTDGVSWGAAGRLGEYWADYAFASDTDGVFVVKDKITATHDGGRTWNTAYECRAKVVVEGLMRDWACTFQRVQFLTPQMGYAIGRSDAGPSLNLAFLARTDDGGQTWTLKTAPVNGEPYDLFFIDENTGYIRTGERAVSGQLFKTTDGGTSWKGLAGSTGERIKFADPEVGWSVNEDKVSFTHDGGNKWNSREYPFPARIRAFSLPRRDRAYVIGNHGMIYRYNVVPAEYAAKGMIAAAKLAPVDLTVPNELQQLSAESQSLQASVSAPEFTPAPTTPIENTLNTVVAQAPAFVSHYRNLNLLNVGLQMMSGLPQQIVDLKRSLALARSGPDPAARATAAADFSTKLQGVIAFMNTNFHSPLLARRKAAQ